MKEVLINEIQIIEYRLESDEELSIGHEPHIIFGAGNFPHNNFNMNFCSYETDFLLISKSYLEYSKIIEIKAKNLKSGKNPLYESTISIYDSNKTSLLKQNIIELHGTKNIILIQSTERAFKILEKDYPESKGISIQIRIDKSFIKLLKKAYQIADSIQDELKKALQEQDIAKLKELEELQQTANILAYFQIFPFIFDPI